MVDWPMEILIDDMVLRPVKITPDLAREMYDVFISDVQNARYFMPHGNYKSADEVFASYSVRGQNSAGAMMYGIFRAGRLIGEVGFISINLRDNTADLGYWLRPDARGAGVIGKCLRALEAVGFAHLDVLYITCDVENAASRNVAVRAGYKLDGIRRAAIMWPDGTRHDECMYSKLKSEWEKEIKK